MEEPERRRQLNVWLSIEALRAWQSFAERHGTNVTALAEALGHHLAEFALTPTDNLPASLAEVVKRSQQIAGTRSSRSRRSDT